MNPRRLPIIVVILVTIAALVIADRNQTAPARADVVAQGALMPVTSPPAAVSSSFFCAGGTATAGGGFDATIVIANPNPTAITTTITSFPAASPSDTAGTAAVAALQPVAKQVQVGPRARADVHLADILASPFAAALVETNDPDVAVEHRITTAQGSSSSPCASAASKTWFLPTGTTTRDAHEFLAVFNPFSADAVVDVTFQTNDGFRSPDDLQGLPVAGRHLRIIDVTADVPRLEQLAAFVTARAGQVVVDRLQSFDGSDPNHPGGTAVTLGAPQPAPVWTFPEGEVVGGLRESFTVVNPSNQPQQVRLEITLDNPATSGVVDPIPITVPPNSYSQVALQDQTRVPKGIGHSVTVRSVSGPGVIAERVISGAAPAPRRGYGPALGAPLQATNWLFADGSAVANTSAEFVTIFNPSPDTVARVSVAALAQGQSLAIDQLQNIEVQPAA
ncbi:MAG TPA: DUF5719 family protein, partial [Acidimicrobiales bacterium]